jgi:outer membrane protein assembly factor BamB
MTIKVQCGCGARYSFDVEPQDGRMPFAVNCPQCNADGTEAANQVIAQTLAAEQPAAPRLRMATAPSPPSQGAAPHPIPMAVPQEVRAGAAMRRIEAEARSSRRAVGTFIGILLLFVALLGGWFWFSFFGSKPKMVSSLKLTGPSAGWRMQFLDADKIILASDDRVILHNIRTDKDVWSTALSDKTPGRSEDYAQAPQLFLEKDNIWVCTGDRVLRLDQKSGDVKQNIPVIGQFASFTPTATNILLVSEQDETHRIAIQVDLSNDEISSQNIAVPRSEKRSTSDELPPNVQPTAGVLLAQATDEQKFNKPLDAMSSEFFSAGQNLVEMRVKLLEPKVTWVQSIKPRGPSRINGQLTASTAGVEQEVFNDIKRSQTGGVKGIDESRYDVKLRRWIGNKPVQWEGEVNGLPGFFSLETVDLLTAGKALAVFDKQNNKLFEASLSYPVGDDFISNNPGHRSPAVEKDGMLYLFDQGVLTAFTLPEGQVGWRLPSVGIRGVKFDSKGMLYVDSTMAAPEDIQYTDEIKLESAASVILKVDPRSGKILWQAQNVGRQSFLSGKYLYSTSAEMGGIALANGLSEALNAPHATEPAYFHMWRLDPETGKVMWAFSPDQPPDEVSFEENWFALRFGDEVQTWKFLTL